MEQSSVMAFTFLVLLSLLVSVHGCDLKNIEIRQGPGTPLPSGIPAYLVEISNVCPTNCAVSNIHVSCGMFSSATVIRPNVFKRIADNDCLVNGGQPLPFGGTVSFVYANTFPYSLTVSSVSC